MEQDITVSGFVASLLVKVSLVIIAALLVRIVFPASTESPAGSAQAANQVATGDRLSIEQPGTIANQQGDSALYAANPELQIHHRFLAARESGNEPGTLAASSGLPADGRLELAGESNAGAAAAPAQ